MMNSMNHWADAFEAMPEQQFFKLIRLYLGEIQTPYNKQRLISQLASFIKTPEHTQSILSYLDEKDVSFLTAISLIPNATQQMILDFFSGTNTSEIFAELISLSERLIIYTTKDKYSDTVFYHINPLLSEPLQKYLSIKSIFPENEVSEPSKEDTFSLSPNFLASFISYIQSNKLGCKNDGSIKKTDLTKLQEIFSEQITCLQPLVNAFINLSLIIDDGKAFSINKVRVEAFSKLSQIEQYSLLTISSCCKFSRENLRKQAQLLVNALNSIPETGFSTKEILRLIVLAGTHTEEGSAFGAKSRFSQILEKVSATENEGKNNTFINATILEEIIESAITFGLLKFAGKTKDGLKIYTKNQLPQLLDSSIQIPRVLNLDSTFTATLMPGLSLDFLLPLTSFLSIKKSGIVTEFEITRQSVSSSFDKGWNPKSIFEELEKFTHYELPQNFKINIQEWYKSYDSARLFCGYVLKVADSNIAIAENNPKIKKYIKEKLADGIYLLDIPVNSEIKTFIKESGFDFLGCVQQSEPPIEQNGFPKIFNNSSIFSSINSIYTNKPQQTISVSDSRKKINNLKDIVLSKQLDKQQKESLLHKISNRLILSEEQLNSTSVRIEILEAEGMDFAGKIHLVETAIKEDDMMELTFPDVDSKGFFTIVGTPLGIAKQPGEAFLKFQIEPSKEIENFLISKITHLRRIHF